MSHPVVVGEFPGSVWGAANDSPVPVNILPKIHQFR